MKSGLNTPTLEILSSFVPDIINEIEERDRLAAMAQRDFLIKSHGIPEQIYWAMKKNGSLKSADIKKYGFYGKTGGDKSELFQSARCTNRKLYQIGIMDIQSSDITAEDPDCGVTKNC